MSGKTWILAAELLASFVRDNARLEHLLERLPSEMGSRERGKCQSLLYGAVRNIRFLESVLGGFFQRRPKRSVWAALLVATRELMERPEKREKIVHHAVEQIGRRFSLAEKRMANAVLRKVPARIDELLEGDLRTETDLAMRFSHPNWLVSKWIGQYGWEETRALLEWNQREPEVYGRWQRDSEELDFLKATQWQRFFQVERGSWQQLSQHVASGRFYLQNPGARFAPEMLAKAFGKGRILDLCSSPGGKAIYLESILGEALKELEAVDLPGPRFERLKRNLENYACLRSTAVPSDLFSLDAAELGRFEAVLLDAPCSNVGVMQRKVDVRWRLEEKGIAELVSLQKRMIRAAARFVGQGGSLVYSTCSFDRIENEKVVDAFLQRDEGDGFRLESAHVSYPWKDGHDGSGVFVLRRK